MSVVHTLKALFLAPAHLRVQYKSLNISHRQMVLESALSNIEKAHLQNIVLRDGTNFYGFGRSVFLLQLHLQYRLRQRVAYQYALARLQPVVVPAAALCQT